MYDKDVNIIWPSEQLRSSPTKCLSCTSPLRTSGQNDRRRPPWTNMCFQAHSAMLCKVLIVHQL